MPPVRRIVVRLSVARRARHIGVYAHNREQETGGRYVPLCSNAGRFPYVEYADEAPDVPWCLRCKSLAEQFAAAVQS